MDLHLMKEILNQAENFHESSNYYFHMHKCRNSDDEVKVLMDYKLAVETNDKIIKFGQCPFCKDIFFHNDFESRSL